MKTRFVSSNISDGQWKKIEKERSLILGAQSDELASSFLLGMLKDILHIGCFPTHSGAKINDLTVDFFRGVIDEAH
jgi:hypothetical protein